ncbi:MAG TPA: FAD-dependent monooxygenase [Actinoplanes sp.]|nr:FAD-dependent monooxygenase [Actinoplanes sp.]
MSTNVVVIVGAGIGGLAAAAALGRQGVRCVVVERARTLPVAGGALQIAPNGSAVLHRLGLAPLLAGAARPARRDLRRWRDDAQLGSVELGAAASERYGSPYYTLRRATLCRMLLDAAARHADVRFGVSCAGVLNRGDRAVVLLADGTRLPADAVLGADGLRSVVRQSLVTDRPRYSGFAVYRATVPRESGDRIVVRLGPGRHCVSYPLDGGRSTNVVAVVRAAMPPAAARDVPAREVLAAFAGWSPAMRDLLAAAGRFDRHGLFDRARPAWGRGRVVLLGDAAHPMLPFLAQGAGQALEDAATLAVTGFEGYRAARSARVARLSAAVLTGARDNHLDDGPAQRARDARLATADLSGHDWLYGPPIGARA